MAMVHSKQKPLANYFNISVIVWKRKKQGDGMQPKTQMRIGLWGAVLIVVYIIFRMISNMPLSLAKLAVFLFWLIMYGTYILSIIRKNLKTVKIVYYLYLTVVIILFCGYFVSSIVLFRKSGDYHSLKVDYVFLFCNMLIYGLEILFYVWEL